MLFEFYNRQGNIDRISIFHGVTRSQVTNELYIFNLFNRKDEKLALHIRLAIRDPPTHPCLTVSGTYLLICTHIV